MRGYQDNIRFVFLAGYGRTVPLTGPVALELVFARGLGVAGKRKATSRPDLTNLQKACEDALNGFAFLDDAQVVSVRASKITAAEPYTSITVQSI